MNNVRWCCDQDQTSFFAGDKVKMLDFPKNGGLTFSQRKESKHHPDEEIISDDEVYDYLEIISVLGLYWFKRK